LIYIELSYNVHGFRSFSLYFILRLDGGCRHLAAALFDLEATLRENLTVTCTSRKCIWIRKTQKNYAGIQIKDLKLTKEEFGKTVKDYPSPHYLNYDPRPVHITEYNDIFDVLKSTTPSAGILSWIPSIQVNVYTEQEVDEHVSDEMNVQWSEEVDDNIVLLTIQEYGDMFVKEKQIEREIELSREQCEEFVTFIHMDRNQKDMLYDKTIGQGQTDLWMKHRAGRLTASNVYKICHLKESTDPTNTVKLLMNYCPMNKDYLPAPLQCGHMKEISAKNLYQKKMQGKHKHFSIAESGLVVCDDDSFIAASPDGICYCSCCGKKLIEVKSIFSKKNLQPSVAAADKLEENAVNKKPTLKENTSWYYQIQCQMAVTKVHKTDLVIYTNKGIMIIPVEFNLTRWENIYSKLKDFYFKAMVPEILFGHIRMAIQAQ